MLLCVPIRGVQIPKLWVVFYGALGVRAKSVVIGANSQVRLASLRVVAKVLF